VTEYIYETNTEIS